MNRDLPVQRAVSAGGVVWRRTPGTGVEVVVCGLTRENRWSLPKGTPDSGETIEQTALREVREETGLEVKSGPKVGTIRYWFTANGVRFHKMVHHWLMEPIGGDVSNHDHEFDDVRWLPIGQAHRLLTYADERKILADAAKVLGEHI